MSFWKKLFGGSKPTPGAPVTPQPRQAPSTASVTSQPAKQTPSGGGLQLPAEFDGKTSYRDMFATLPPERLRAMCRALPIEQLDLERPGRPPIAHEMGRAITQVFAISIYMATKAVPAEFGDIVFPRLVAKIGTYNGAALHLELCDLVRDLAIQLAAGDRDQEAVRVLRVLKGSLFWRAWPQGDLCLFASLNNIAISTKSSSDFKAALEAAQHIPASQLNQIGGNEAIERLKEKMALAQQNKQS